MKILQKIVIVFLLILLPQLTSAQCAMCRAVLESEADGGAAEAINDGIVYLMIWPYILIGGVGFVIYRMIKKASTSN
jgi:cobalamin biosynthesis protein CobD/CbiB